MFPCISSNERSERRWLRGLRPISARSSHQLFNVGVWTWHLVVTSSIEGAPSSRADSKWIIVRVSDIWPESVERGSRGAWWALVHRQKAAERKRSHTTCRRRRQLRCDRLNRRLTLTSKQPQVTKSMAWVTDKAMGLVRKYKTTADSLFELLTLVNTLCWLKVVRFENCEKRDR